MYFRILQNRMVAVLKEKVRSGELTERGLSRLTGVSQPHIHNVLKGIRILSPDVSDRILRKLKLSLFDLLPGDEPHSPLPLTNPDAARCGYLEVPLLEGRLGPGLPMPESLHPQERFPFPATYIGSFEQPVAVRLARDDGMRQIFRENDVILLDQSDSKRTQIEHDGLYVISLNGQGLVRRVRCGGRCLYVFTEDGASQPKTWEKIPLAGRLVAEVVRAKVVWVGRDMEVRRPPEKEGPRRNIEAA